MIEVYLKLNKDSGRYECYDALTDDYVQTLTCGNPFILIPDDEDEEVAGRIEYDRVKGYYWIDSEDFTSQKLENDMRGYI